MIYVRLTQSTGGKATVAPTVANRLRVRRQRTIAAAAVAVVLVIAATYAAVTSQPAGGRQIHATR